jgi:hypothetical protein
MRFGWRSALWSVAKIHGAEIGLLFSSVILAGAHLFILLAAARSS